MQQSKVNLIISLDKREITTGGTLNVTGLLTNLGEDDYFFIVPAHVVNYTFLFFRKAVPLNFTGKEMYIPLCVHVTKRASLSV